MLLLLGENDKHHAKLGTERLEDCMDGFVAKLYAEKTKGARLVCVPKYTHMGHWALHNEKLTYLWLWAIRLGYFSSSGVLVGWTPSRHFSTRDQELALRGRQTPRSLCFRHISAISESVPWISGSRIRVTKAERRSVP